MTDIELLKVIGLILIAIFVISLLVSFRNSNKQEDTEMDDERETSLTYDNADANALLEAKMKCLELALKNQSDIDKIITDAKKYWDFIMYEDAA